MRTISTHIRSNVVGYVAVFLALTGTAAALPGKATVQSNDLKANVVKAKHIKDGHVGGADVGDGSLTGADIADAGVTRDDVAPETLTNGQILEESLFNDNSLTGSDIDESTLSIEGGGAPTGPAGGDLTGTYPNPQLGPNSVGTAEVGADALTGADINEATLAGLLRFGATIPSGTTVTGVFGCASNEGVNGLDAVCRDVVNFPLRAPSLPTSVNFAPGGIGEDDPSCSGQVLAPSAPPGQACLYETASLGDSATGGLASGPLGFTVSVQGPSQAHMQGSWAYTAP